MTLSDAPLIIYTTRWCGYCRQLKTVLKRFQIPYDEVDIEVDPVAADFVGSVNGGNRTVPTVRFADGSTLTNPTGREVKAKLAQLAGQPLTTSGGTSVQRRPGFDDRTGNRDRAGQQEFRR